METNQEKYYRAKINDRDRVKQRENSAQTLIFLMYMAIGLILFCFSLLVISPGALILLYVYPMIPNGLSPLQAWIVGISLSIGIIGILFLKTRSWKKTAGFYSVLVFICVLVSFFVPAQLEGTTLADSAWVVFSPFRKAPLQTTTSSSHLAAKMFTQKSHQDNVSISPAKINMNGSNFSHQVAQPHGVSLEDTSQVDETNTHQPSFDCSKSTNQLEGMICSDSSLAKFDVLLSETYNSKIVTLSSNEAKELRENQRAWIKQAKQCHTVSCVSSAYRMRIEQLNSL